MRTGVNVDGEMEARYRFSVMKESVCESLAVEKLRHKSKDLTIALKWLGLFLLLLPVLMNALGNLGVSILGSLGFLCLAAVYVVCFIFAMWRAVQAGMKKDTYLLRPLLMWVAIAGIWFALPLAFFGHSLRLWFTLDERNQVVEMVMEKKDIDHPAEFAEAVRMHGFERVTVERAGHVRIYFHDDPWILDNHAGFIFRSDLSSPGAKDFGGDIVGISNLRDHWWYVTFT